MNKNPLNKGVITKGFAGIGAVTRAMIDGRARELAVMAGRESAQVTQVDYERAKRELTGEDDMDRQDALIEKIPEDNRWDPVPGSEGQEIQDSPSEDEDDEGRSETEQLFDEGAEEAERDRVLQAARASEKDK